MGNETSQELVQPLPLLEDLRDCIIMATDTEEDIGPVDVLIAVGQNGPVHMADSPFDSYEEALWECVWLSLDVKLQVRRLVVGQDLSIKRELAFA